MNGSAHTANPDYQLTVKLLNHFREQLGEQFKSSGVDEVKFYRLNVVALSQLAAMLAVDVGMQPENFTAICQAQFDMAVKQAPRFG